MTAFVNNTHYYTKSHIQYAFTLIELLVVIAIIAILGTLLLFADGHVEIHRWRDPRTPKAQMFAAVPNSKDYLWVILHATGKK